MTMNGFVRAAVLIWVAGTAVFAFEDVKRAAENGVTYRVLSIHGDEKQQVPAEHKFYTGDKFKLQIKLRESAYVYVLNRSFDGDPEQTANEQSKGRYAQLYPAEGAKPPKFMGGVFREMPVMLMEMDPHPGQEKFYVIVSDQPLNLPAVYGSAIAPTGAAQASESDSAAVDHLNKDLAEWARGCRREKNSEGEIYTVGARARPLLMEITLRHYGK